MAQENASENARPATLAVLGGGAMAGAIVLGAGRAGAIDHRTIVVADPDKVKRDAFEAAGVQAVANFQDAAPRLTPDTQVLLAVKPQILPDAAPDVAQAAGDTPRVVISVLAGTTGAGVRRALGGWARVVRVMPNTPARVGKGVSAVTLSDGAEPGDDALARKLMSSVGEVIDLDESLFDAFTAVAGSGPAYVFYLAEAMRNAAVAVGLGEQQADRAVRGVIAGAAELLVQDPGHARRGPPRRRHQQGRHHRRRHRRPGRRRLNRIMTAAVTAARDRGRELGSDKTGV